MSVFVANSGNTPADVLVNHSDYSLAAISAGLARSHNQIVVRAQQAGLPSHAEVVGHKTKAVSSALAKGSTWVVPPLPTDN